MADRTNTRRRSHDRGFTLVEVVIVLTISGIITAAVAATITVVLRNTPPSEVRVDDARSMQGLVTWLPQDVDAAPPEGFHRGHSYWPCAGTAPAKSYNVVTAEWQEPGATTLSFAAAYRYESTGEDTWAIRRYTCDDDGSGTMGAATQINLTAGLPEWDVDSPPSWVTMCRTAVTTGGSCQDADVVPQTVDQPNAGNGGGIKSLQLSVRRHDGGIVTIDAAPKNPDQDLADDPYSSMNGVPTLDTTYATVQMYAGETITVDLATTHNPVDPDGDPISVALDSTEVLPAGITVSTSDPLDVEITADAALGLGTVAPGIVLIVSDNRAGWVDAVLNIEIVAKPNLSPTVDVANYHLEIISGDDVVLPLDATHGVTDPDGDPLTVAVVSYPATFTTPPKVNEPGPLDLLVKTPSGKPLGPASDPVELTVSDGVNSPVTITITIEFIAAPNTAPTSTVTNIDIDMYADDSITLSLDTTHGVVDADGDALSITEIDAQPTALSLVLDGGLDITIETDPGLTIGTLSPVIDLDVEDPLGARLELTITVTIIPTPPPPSNCELLTLTATPNPVARHAKGSRPHLLAEDVRVTLTYSGSCDGLHLNYDSGDTSGLGIGTGRVFPAGSPTSVVIVSKSNGGTEKWAPDVHTLTASTTSTDAIVATATTTLTVT